MHVAQALSFGSGELRQRSLALPQWLIALAYVLLTAAAVYPVLSVSIPPLVDYPGHLARLHVLTAVHDVPLLAERYAVDWNILPNLAMDAMVYGLAGWLPVEASLRLFVALAMVLIVAGSLAIHRALFGRIGLMPAAVFLLLYNHVLVFGFINYLFGAGLYLLIFAAWIGARHWSAWRRVLLFSLASVGLFFAHLFAFGMYGLSVAAYELWRSWSSQERNPRAFLQDWAITLAQFLPSIVLWAASPIGERNSYTKYGVLKDKLLALHSPVWTYGDPLDRVTFLVLGLLLVRGLFGGYLKIATELRYPLIALLVAALVMPNWLLGVWGVDFRLPLVLACLVAAGTRLDLPNAKAGLVLAAVGLALFGERVWTISETWHRHDAAFSEFRRASQAIEPGARLLMVQTQREDEKFDQVYWHLAAIAVIERSVFLPTLFSDRTAQPVHVTEAYEYIDTPFGTPITPDMLRAAADPDTARMTGEPLPTGHRLFWLNWPQNFDYVLHVHFGENENPMPALLRRVHHGSYFDIYRVVRG